MHTLAVCASVVHAVLRVVPSHPILSSDADWHWSKKSRPVSTADRYVQGPYSQRDWLRYRWCEWLQHTVYGIGLCLVGVRKRK